MAPLIAHRNAGLLLLMSCLGCSTTPDGPPPQMWVATQTASPALHVAHSGCETTSQQSVGSIDTTLTVWIDPEQFERCMEHEGWALEQISGVAPTSRVTSHVNVRSKPSAKSRVMAKLAKGVRAGYLTEVQGWYRVRLDDGSKGYVSSNWTELVSSKQ